MRIDAVRHACNVNSYLCFDEFDHEEKLLCRFKARAVELFGAIYRWVIFPGRELLSVLLNPSLSQKIQ
jgi:hypothetical protein